MRPAFLGIDVGKTSLRLACFSGNLQELARVRIPVTDVETVKRELRNHLAAFSTEFTILSAGIAMFGPLDVDPRSATYGAIGVSSEPMWSGVNLPALLATVMCCPIRFDYDVNSGALAEHALGNAAGTERFAYLSLGTGIGAAFYAGGLQPGVSPQFGHSFVPREPDDPFLGSCRFHGACLQGLASGKALAERWGQPAETLPPDHPGWDLQARYVARACVNLVYTLLPQRILLASSGALAPGLLGKANLYLIEQLNGFLDPATSACYAAVPPVVLAKLTPDSSLVGAAVIARDRLGMLYADGPDATRSYSLKS